MRWGWFVETDYERTGHYIRQNGGLQVDPKDNTKAVFDSTPALGGPAVAARPDVEGRALARNRPICQPGVNSVRALALGNLAMADRWLLGYRSFSPGLRRRPTSGTSRSCRRGRRSAHHTPAPTDGRSSRAASSEKGAWTMMRFLQTDAWIEPAIGTAATCPRASPGSTAIPTLMKQASPQLADKNLAFHRAGQAGLRLPAAAVQEARRLSLGLQRHGGGGVCAQRAPRRRRVPGRGQADHRDQRLIYRASIGVVPAHDPTHEKRTAGIYDEGLHHWDMEGCWRACSTRTRRGTGIPTSPRPPKRRASASSWRTSTPPSPPPWTRVRPTSTICDTHHGGGNIRIPRDAPGPARHVPRHQHPSENGRLLLDARPRRDD